MLVQKRDEFTSSIPYQPHWADLKVYYFKYTIETVKKSIIGFSLTDGGVIRLLDYPAD